MSEEQENENVYNQGGREDMVDNDEISPEEEGFMKGYDDSEDNDDDDGTVEEGDLY